MACGCFVFALLLHPNVVGVVRLSSQLSSRLVPSILMFGVAATTCVCIVGVLRPNWSIIIIQRAWTNRSSDAIFSLLPLTVVMHIGSFCAIKYTAACRVALSAVLLGIVPAVLAGTVMVPVDGLITWWLVFQLLLVAGCTVGGAYFAEYRQRLMLVSHTAATAAEAEANEVVSNLLPKPVVDRILSGQEVPSQVHKGVAILVSAQSVDCSRE
jgi:hypothetical protein